MDLAHHPMQQGLAIFNQTGQSEPAPTSAIIHWMPIMTQLWMNFFLVNIWFHLGDPLCKK
jgi:hypothetical protein